MVAYLLILTVFMLVYRTNRTRKIKLLRADIARVSAEQNKTKSAEAEVARLTHLIPAAANTPAFIEALYRSAREAGLTQHEVSTEGDKGSGSARPGGTDTSSIVKQRLKISVSGNYRNFAEYVRRVQNNERFNRIIDLKLAPDKDQLKGTLTVELSSLPVKQ